jgi:hypothetical protein
MYAGSIGHAFALMLRLSLFAAHCAFARLHQFWLQNGSVAVKRRLQVCVHVALGWFHADCCALVALYCLMRSVCLSEKEEE